MLHVHRRIVIAVGVFLCSACESLIDADVQPLHFQGTVTSAADGKPVSGAIVSLDRAAFVFQSSVSADTTDQSGRYKIDYSARCKENSDLYTAPGDAYLLVASAVGYAQLSSVNIGATLRCATGVQTINFRLEPRS